MTEQEFQRMDANIRKAIEVCNLGDTIQGEVNRMCVTHDLTELDSMALHARKNIEKLQKMRYEQLKGAKMEGDYGK